MPLKSNRAINLGLISSGEGCPVGEQLVNRGFEKGDFTGWYPDIDASISNTTKRSGNYSCRLAGYEAEGSIAQPLNKILASCISALGFFAINGDLVMAPTTVARALIFYDDGTFSSHIFTGIGATWVYCNLLPYLSLSKYVIIVWIEAIVNYPLIYVDDATLFC